ncbi:MAG: protein kinase [Pyrinomonadaceae bacterium]|nr:protein kinase [Pyrinomonadaceae bacterium]MBP6211459.1 protein kinase [Pyrinomonadaceae bacterium]
MTPERWSQIEEIFQTALDLPRAERRRYVRESCSDDNDLLLEVEKLLSQFDESSDFIEQPLIEDSGIGVLASLMQDDEDPVVGRMIGSYRIEREVGRGGMGTVYEAVRADGAFRMRVAIKLVKRGMDTDFILKRFRNERQILATLEHPFITRLIDGGTTDDGRPYFVMDYIDGLPLYRYCDKNRLTITERLELFGRICEAVEYAHQKRVIHRDLKPSNIIVTDDGSPRLLDFGIAKLLDPDLAHDTLQPTATALRMMTVDYASPEQVRGEKVTYATDIYSLGVILFELLTGYRPYAVANRSPHDIARAICDDDPALPSSAVSGERHDLLVVKVNAAAETIADIAARRREAPTSLGDELRGNLDNIILKALRKDPTERYRSVGKLREDIDRHLSGGSVSIEFSYPPLRREPRTSTTPGQKLVAVLPLSVLSPAGTHNTDEAYLTVGLADAIITRLTSVRKLTVRPTSSITRYEGPQINPLRAGLELGVDFVLDGRIRRFGERLRISLQLLDVHQGTAIWAGQFDENLTDVLALEDAISEQVAAVLIPHLTGEEKQKLSKRGTDNPEAYEYFLKGRFYWNQFTPQSLPKAIESYMRAIDLDPNYALVYVGIADFYIWANIYGLVPNDVSYDHASKAAKRALEIDNQLGEAYASLALITLNQFRWGEAEKLILHALDLAPNYPLAHEWYSSILVPSGRRAEGIAEMRRAEELDPMSLRTKTLVAWTCYQAGDFKSALEKAIDIVDLDENYPQGHLQVGYVLCQLGRVEEGLASMRRALELMPDSALAKSHFGLCLASAGRHEEAVVVAAELKAEAKTGYVKPMFLFYACVAAGEIDEAFAYLKISIEERDPWLVWLGTEPKIESIRKDPRYAELYNSTRTPPASNDYVGHVTDPFPDTSVDIADAKTSYLSELPTLAFRKTFISRHYLKLSAFIVVIIGLLTAYQTGVLTFSFTSDHVVPSTTQPGRHSIAVLPFQNSTGDPANDYLCDGMSESLINRLGRSPEVRIISRSAAFSYRSKHKDPLEIGRELGVDSILVGNLKRQNDDVIIETELLRVTDGKREFSMNFSETADRVSALQDLMVARVSEALNLSPGAKPAQQKSYTENNEAFQFYLKGEFNRQKGTPAGTQASIENYEKALQIDPYYALAYQGLALAYRSAPAYGSMPPQEAYPRSREAAEKALSLDPSLSSAYVSLASIKATFNWDFPAAEDGYKSAIELAPNNTEAHYSYGNFLVAMGRTEEALNEFRIAQQLDPLSLNIMTNIGWANYIAGRYDEAATLIRQVLTRDPNFARAYLNLGEILQEQGKYDEAIVAFQKAKELSKDPLADMALGHAYATAGRKAEATRIAVDLEEKVREKQVSPFLPAVVYAGLNEKDKSFYWLERAFQERSNWLTLIKVGRRLKPLHGDPRFDDLLKRVGFEPTRL